MKKQLLDIGQLAINDLPALRAAVIALGHERGGDWKRYGDKFVAFLDTGDTQFTVYMKGNSKLPFYAFSALPIITCPGVGACGDWCYSFKAWRYPAAYFRQLQNTVLILHQRETLARQFAKLPAGVVFRLYVDGDIDSLRTLGFWMELLRTRPDVAAYGYSKSWPLFLSYAASNKFPPNYKLNLSGGGRYGEDYKRAMLALDCVRGEFVAFKVATRQKANPTQYRRDVAQAAKAAGHERVFVCPGKCGECANGAHACGSAKFAGVAVAIGIH
jgi:hypothetical protein